MVLPLSLDELTRTVEAGAGEGSPVDRLRQAVELAEQLHELGDQLVDGFVGDARRAGCSWAEIGSVLGVSKQAAQQRFVVQPAVPAAVWPARFGDGARRAIARGLEEARALGHDYLGTEHVLLGLVAQPDDVAANVLGRLGVTESAVREEIRELVGVFEPSEREELRLRPRMKEALELAQQQATVLGDDCPGSEHLLLGIVNARSSLARRILDDLGVTEERVRDQLAATLGLDASKLTVGVRPRRRRVRKPVRRSS